MGPNEHLLKALAVVFALIMLGTRVPAIFWPGKFRGFAGRYSELPLATLKCAGVLLVGLGLCVFYIVLIPVNLLKLFVLLFGFVLTFLGVLHVGYTNLIKRAGGRVAGESDLTLRLVSAGTILFALLMGWLIFWR